ncbi:hypothetical protein I316_06478 [Kwoniella heveanensis BCC8398]|uniref:Uncharacterized protein n=1 Tax=Kwoniella heveanensis BCC8398 TaxID=1296120 RepID=A0A1B9GLD6_9TREE|nr:hypothetical protein I316_06478 [Kwoniella heveanensis BCC8398]
MKRYKDHQGLRKAMEKFGWTIGRAEEVVAKALHKVREAKARKEMEEAEVKESSEGRGGSSWSRGGRQVLSPGRIPSEDPEWIRRGQVSND